MLPEDRNAVKPIDPNAIVVTGLRRPSIINGGSSGSGASFNSDRYLGNVAPPEEIIVVNGPTGSRAANRSIVVITWPQNANKPCGGQSGGTLAEYASGASDIFAAGAAAAAISGLEPVAAGLEGLSLAASGIKALAQYNSGDSTGALVTASGSLVGFGTGRILGAVSGEFYSASAQRLSRVGTAANGQFANDATVTAGNRAFCPGGR